MTTTIASAAVTVACLVLLPEVLARTTIFDRRPRVGLAVWAADCVVGWCAALVVFLRVALGDAHGGLVTSLVDFVRHLGDGHPLRGLGLAEVVGLSLAFDIGVLLVGGLAVTGVRAWRMRRRQRVVLDLVAEAPDARGISLLRHALPLAYYLPGDGGRVVLSTGTLELLTPDEVKAVVAHERGHRHGGHGALLVPLQVLSSFVPFLPLARRAPGAMRSFLEMSADDYSRARGPVEPLRGALSKAALFQPPPAAALGAFDGTVERRIRRLELAPTPWRDAVLITAVACGSLSVLGTLVTLR